jgi:ABC-type Fe3+-hydroxamate transport system substrate-binding protein
MKISKTEGIFLRNIILILSCLAFTLISYGMDEKNITNGESRTITDMAGRRVKIPVKVTKVLTTSPPPSTFIFMLAPEKLGGWVAAPSKRQLNSYQGINIIYCVFGLGRQSNNKL